MPNSYGQYSELNGDTMVPAQLRHPSERADEESPTTPNSSKPLDTPGSVFLPHNDHNDLWTPFRNPSGIESSRRFSPRTAAMSNRTRILKLYAFIGIELLWLGFALLTSFHIFVTDAGDKSIVILGKTDVSYAALLRSSLSVVGIIFQLVALLPVASITVEVYAGEWVHILAIEHQQFTHATDRVSTLTSSFQDRVEHLFDRRSSRRYRIAFTVTLMSLLLQAIAPGALIISSQYIGFDTNVAIGILNDTDPSLTQKLLLGASRLEYSTWIENSTETFHLDSSNLLYGMPSRDFLGLNTRLEYQSDAVQYQFECQWIPPTYIDGGSLIDSSWSFGGDMSATFDYFAMPSLDFSQVSWIYGLWPLLIISGSGAKNGSFAWLFIGGIPAGQNITPIDVSSIPAASRTHNDTGWVDLLGGQLPAWYSTEASVLFCDPHMSIVTVHVALNGQHLSEKVQQADPVGNINYSEGSMMLGRSINGMPWDSAIDPTATEYALSTLAVKFALEQISDKPPVFAPLPLSNLTANLQTYTQVAGVNVYLGGSFGSMKVPAQSFKPIDRLICSWPQWGASVGFSIIIASLLAIIIFAERRSKRLLVPLTAGAVASALETEVVPFQPRQSSPLRDDHSKEPYCT